MMQKNKDRKQKILRTLIQYKDVLTFSDSWPIQL